MEQCFWQCWERRRQPKCDWLIASTLNDVVLRFRFTTTLKTNRWNRFLRETYKLMRRFRLSVFRFSPRDLACTKYAPKIIDRDIERSNTAFDKCLFCECIPRGIVVRRKPRDSPTKWQEQSLDWDGLLRCSYQTNNVWNQSFGTKLVCLSEQILAGKIQGLQPRAFHKWQSEAAAILDENKETTCLGPFKVLLFANAFGAWQSHKLSKEKWRKMIL